MVQIIAINICKLILIISFLIIMNKQLAQILNQLKELLPIIKEKYFVESIEVLGSYIRD